MGHLLLLPRILKRLPKHSQRPDIFEVLSLNFKYTDSLFYLDLWPFSSPFLIVSSPAYAIQACQQHDIPRPSVLESFFSPFAGGNSLFIMNGAGWKRSRSLFNSDFSTNYILEQTAHIIAEAEVYVDILREHARKGDMFPLDEVALWYTMDIIGAVTLHVLADRSPARSRYLSQQVLWIRKGCHY